MIKSFRDSQAEAIFLGQKPGKRFPAELLRPARRKLLMLDAATSLDDCRIPPGNRLESLSGDREGQHSVRINDQFRICFRWQDGVNDVEIVDYHR